LKRAYFLGSDHGTDPRRFVYWDDADNGWHTLIEKLPTPFYGTIPHGWSWNTGNLKGTRFYRGLQTGTFTDAIWIWDTVNNVLIGQSSPNPDGYGTTAAAGVEYFPEARGGLGAVILADTPVNHGLQMWYSDAKHPEPAGVWGKFPTHGSPLVAGTQGHLKYNPRWRALWNAGGDNVVGQPKASNKIDPDGRVWKLADAPYVFDHYFSQCVPASSHR